jgi:hypothetical protein
MRKMHRETQLIMQRMRTRGEAIEEKIECALRTSAMAHRSAKGLDEKMIHVEACMGWMSFWMKRFGMPHFEPLAVLTVPG